MKRDKKKEEKKWKEREKQLNMMRIWMSLKTN